MRAHRCTALVVALLALAPAMAWTKGPAGLTGTPLTRPTHLQLVVAGSPPAIVHVDLGSISPLDGIPPTGPGGAWVMPTRDGALAAIVRKGVTRAVRISSNGTTTAVTQGLGVLPVAGSDDVWVMRTRAGGGCTLARASRSRAVRTSCGFLESDGPAGVVIGTQQGERLIDPTSGRVLLTRTGDGSTIVPLHGQLVLDTAGGPPVDTAPLELRNLANGHATRLHWPSGLDLLDGIAVAPSGPLVAVGFANPSGDPQAEDLFLLDTRTGRFTHVPGFPINEDLKFSSVAWTRDGRLVMTSRLNGKSVLGVYRPGDRAVSVMPLELPPNAGSDTFVPLVSG
jgi:hypothetical protein